MQPISFRTEDGLSLEGEIREPDGEARGSAVICHPHPLGGGSKDHPILWAIRNELARRGFAVLSFNFRGVMGSEGSFGGGDAEVQDVRAAVDRVRETAAGPTFVAAWSFGGMVALREALSDDRVAALALAGFPVSEETDVPRPDIPSRAELSSLRRPVLFVVGEADQFSPLPELRRLAARLPGAELVVIPDTDHFFWRRERELAERIGGFAEGTLLP
ncbi:MAG: alpha/beta hydrolase [Actinomycetota bacterium]